MKSKFIALISLAIALTAIGCTTASTTVDSAYVKADRDTFTALTSVVTEYETNHPDLAPALSTKVQSWDLRTSSAEQRLAASTQPSN